MPESSNPGAWFSDQEVRCHTEQNVDMLGNWLTFIFVPCLLDKSTAHVARWQSSDSGGMSFWLFLFESLGEGLRLIRRTDPLHLAHNQAKSAADSPEGFLSRWL